jgi:hypothetical protein
MCLKAIKEKEESSKTQKRKGNLLSKISNNSIKRKDLKLLVQADKE